MNIMITHACGAKSKPLARLALEHQLYDPDRVFVYLFNDIVHRYQSRGMSKWVVALAYDGAVPVAVVLATTKWVGVWVGVYVTPAYRHQHIASALMQYVKPYAVSFHSCTDDPVALAFFSAVQCSPLE